MTLWAPFVFTIGLAAGFYFGRKVTDTEAESDGFHEGFTAGATMGERHIVSADTLGPGSDVFNEIVADLLAEHAAKIRAEYARTHPIGGDR